MQGAVKVSTCPPLSASRRENMQELKLKIEGMSCQHCVMSVQKALSAVDGVESSDVSVGSATVVYDDARSNRDVIITAIRKAGYTAS